MQAPADVEAAVTEMYRAAPEAFVAARDQLARSLRAAKRRDEAAAIAKLRRPSRLAWAFNAARAADARVAARLDEAVAAVTAAQEGDGSIRQASSGLRAAVADLVDTAARTAADAGHHLDRSTLTPAALAVVGDPEALGQLQAGRLGEVPEGGGFGFGLELPAEPVAPSDRERAGSERATTPAARKAGTRAGKASPARRGGRPGRGTAAADDDAGDAADEAGGAGPSPEELTAARGAVRDAEGEEAAATDAVEEAERALSDAGDAVGEAERRRAAAERAVAEAEARREAAEEALAAARKRRNATREAVASARAALAELDA